MDIKKLNECQDIINNIEKLKKLKHNLFFEHKYQDGKKEFLKSSKLINHFKFFAKELKNDKGTDFTDSVHFIEDQWNRMIDSYVEPLKKQLKEA